MKEKNSKIETAKVIFNGGIIVTMFGVIIGLFMLLLNVPFETPYTIIAFGPTAGGLFTMIIGGVMSFCD